MNKRKKVMWALIIVLLGIVTVRSAFADDLTLQANQSVSVSDDDAWDYFATNFTLTAETNISVVTMAMSGVGATHTLRIHTDNNSNPSNILAHANARSVKSVANSGHNIPENFTFVGNVTLSAGVYWIKIDRPSTSRLWGANTDFSEGSWFRSSDNNSYSQHTVAHLFFHVWGIEAPEPPAAAKQIVMEHNSTVNETKSYNYEVLFKHYNGTSSSNATLFWNDSYYTATQNFINSSYFTFKVNLTLPLSKSNGGLRQFFWNYSIIRTNGTNIYSTTANQTNTILWGYNPTSMIANDSVEGMTNLVYYPFNNLGKATFDHTIDFNGTNFTASAEGNVAYLNVTYPSNISSQTFFYRAWLNVSFNGTSFSRSIAGNNTVSSFSIYNCTNGSVALNLLTNHENALHFMEVETIDVDIEYSIVGGNSSFKRIYGQSFTNTYNASICLSPAGETYTVDAYFINTKSGGYAHRYYLVNANLTNQTSNIFLYNFNTTDDTNTLGVNIVDEFYNPISDVIVKLLRYYPSGVHDNTSQSYAHTWQTVQVDQSDEFGQTVFHVSQVGDTDYQFVMELNNSIVKSTATMKLLCPDPADCEITFLIDSSTNPAPFSLFDQYNWSYNESNEVITINWDDTTLLTEQIDLVISQERADGQIIICGSTFNTPTGSFSCNTSGYGGLILVRGYRTASPLTSFLNEFIQKTKNDLSVILSGEGLATDGMVWSAIIMMTIVGSAATSVIGVIIVSVVGLITLFLVGLTSVINFTFIIAGIIVAFIVALKLRR